MSKAELQPQELSKSMTRRPKATGIEPLLGVPTPCLDHGYVVLVDYMGNQESIVDAARVSYGTGTRKVSTDRGLIRYLLRHRHTTPFEMCEIKLHCKMPIFVARQWIRHRTASVNEYSARYSILSPEHFVPDDDSLAAQSTSNRQGREELVEADYAAQIRELIELASQSCYGQYEFLLNDAGDGQPRAPDRPMLARELARMVLPTNFYTEWYWKIDLHNLLHFLSLRMDAHAQTEIRIYADAIGEIVEAWVPWVWDAFNDYVLEARNFTRPEIVVLKMLLGPKWVQRENIDRYWEVANDRGDLTKREKDEFFSFLGELGVHIED